MRRIKWRVELLSRVSICVESLVKYAADLKGKFPVYDRSTWLKNFSGREPRGNSRSSGKIKKMGIGSEPTSPDNSHRDLSDLVSSQMKSRRFISFMIA